MRIPITMCHGVNTKREPPLDAEHFAHYFQIAAEMGFASISYDELAAWKEEKAVIPERPIMFDFDHPTKSIRHEIQPIMQEFGFRGNLFINTGPMEELYSGPMPDFEAREWMTWDEIRELMDAGWHIRELGVEPQDFAFTGTTWSSTAERHVKKRYRFGRLWIIGSTYRADGAQIRYADLVGVSGADESDGGPPHAARYITKQTDPYRLPSMELEYLIYEYDVFRSYLAKALDE